MSSNDDIIDIEPIDISNIDNSKPASNPTTPKSVNFGPGIELLMNDKIKSDNNAPTEINLGDLDSIENELNNLNSGPTLKEAQSDMFNLKSEKKDDLNMNDTSNESKPKPINNFVKETINNNENQKTWDGYNTFNNIPLNNDTPSEQNLSKEELLREKFKYLKKLENLEKKGIQLTKTYTMESSLSEMQGEYETLVSERERKNSVKFQGKMLMAAITGLEFLNNRFDPFDLKLDGWAEQVNENIDDYDEIFGELHEKYKSKAKMAPELKLLFQLGGGAIMLHMTNTMFKSAMPGMDDIMRQNPELMQQFQQAAVNSMGQSNPNFGSFMGGMMDQEINNGPPPSPIRTKNSKFTANRDQNFFRPDIQAARDGIDITDNFDNPTKAEKSLRPEMKGPSDISDILSGLKTTNINDVITNEKTDRSSRTNPVTIIENNSSTISLGELKEIQSGSSMPKKSNRRKKSDKNTISLDI